MPCRDYYDDHPEEYYVDTIRGLRDQISFAESALCAAIDAAEAQWGDSWIDKIDCAEAGIDRQALLKWRQVHKELDKKHRAAEQRKRMRKLKHDQAKAAIISKLSEEERVALGIKL